MAGLLDMFNPPQGGLLGEDDRRRAQQSALMGLAQGLLSAGQPSRMPVGFGAAIGQGLGGFAQGQGDAMNSAVKAKLVGQQYEQSQMQMQAIKDKQAAMQRVAGRFGSPAMGGTTQVADASGKVGYGNPQRTDIAAIMADPGAMADFVAAGYDPVALHNAMQKTKVRERLASGDILVDENGNTIAQNAAAPKAPEYKDFVEGGKTVTYQINSDGSRVKVSEGPRWNPKEGGGGINLSPAQKSVDDAFGKEYADFVIGGGAADTVKGLAQVRGVIGQLEKETGITGPYVGALPDQARAVLAPQSMAAQEAVSEVVQRNLRLVLGPQFTAKEGEGLIRRAYNPSLGQPENVARLKRLTGAIEKAYQSKMAAARYYEQNGTLTGYKGSTRWTVADIERESGLGGSDKAGGGGSRLTYNIETGELE